MVARDLLAEPPGRLECVGLLLGGELDLGDHQALQVAAVDVQLDLQIAERKDVPALPQPPALGQGPELIEALAAEIDLRLLPRETGAALRGEQQPVALAANPDLALVADRQVSLLDLISRRPAELRGRGHQELPLDLHADTVDSRLDPTGGLAGKRAEIANSTTLR